MSLQNLTSENFKFTIENKNKLILVDFYADWCGPCKMILPIVEEIAKENSDVSVFKLNIDNCPEIAKEFSVKSIPTLISFKDGKVYKKIIGAKSKEEIMDLLK